MKAQTEAPHVAEEVRSALKELGCYRVEHKDGVTYLYEPEFLDVLYDNPRQLVIIAIDCQKLPPEWTAESFDKGKSQAVFRGHLGQRVGTIQTDHTIYLRVALPLTRLKDRGHTAVIEK